MNPELVLKNVGGGKTALGLFSRLSGRNTKASKVLEISSTEPLKRLQQMPVQGFLSDFATALAFVVDSVAKDLLVEESAPSEYTARQIGRPQMEHFSAYLAASFTDALISAYPSIYSRDDGEVDETGRAMISDMHLVREVMYPTTNDDVKAALKMLRASPPLDADGNLNSARLVADRTKTIDSLLGVPTEEKMCETFMNRSIKVNVKFAMMGEFFMECLQQVSNKSQ